MRSFGRCRRVLLCSALLALPASVPAFAGQATVVAGGGAVFSVPLTSVREARFKTVVRQQYDFSCGSAAIATLLTYHYDRPTAEQEVFKAMFDAGDQEAIKTKGFSLLDMKNYLESIGIHADGYKAGLARLAKVGIPAIVLIEIRGYRHFVVVKGVRDGEVVIGDPALGVRIYPRADFEKLMVNHIIFVIRDEIEVARRNFNADRDWAVRAKAPFGTAFGGNSLASFTLLMPGPNAL